MASSFCSTAIEFRSVEDLRKLLETTEKGTLVIAEKEPAEIWGITESIEAMCSANKGVWIDHVTTNPTQKDILDAFSKIGDFRLEEIIAIGGGSSIDMGKAISTFRFLSNPAPDSIEGITRAIKEGTYHEKHTMIPLIAIPTTAGTGSEVTHWATIWDVNKQSKFSIDDPTLAPAKALIIPELTLSLPVKLTLSTGLDALCHASEAFWAKQSNLLVRMISSRAVEVIMDTLPKVLKDPKNLKLREEMACGAMLAGISFAQTHTTACHSLSYPVTMSYGVPHGLACAIFLNEVAEINRPAIEDAEMLFDIYEKHGGIKQWMEETCEGIADLRLRAYGVGHEDLDELVKRTFTKGRMDNNPLDITPEQVKEILEHVY